CAASLTHPVGKSLIVSCTVLAAALASSSEKEPASWVVSVAFVVSEAPSLLPPPPHDAAVKARMRVAGTPNLLRLIAHSHSIVPGGFDVMSYTTRFTAGTSFTMRLAIFARRS